MKTFENKNISEDEAERVLLIVNSKTCSEFSMQKLLDNLTITKNYYDVRISRVSSKDLPLHDNSFFTDGNHNGKSIIIPIIS